MNTSEFKSHQPVFHLESQTYLNVLTSTFYFCLVKRDRHRSHPRSQVPKASFRFSHLYKNSQNWETLQAAISYNERIQVKVRKGEKTQVKVQETRHSLPAVLSRGVSQKQRFTFPAMCGNMNEATPTTEALVLRFMFFLPGESCRQDSPEVSRTAQCKTAATGHTASTDCFTWPWFERSRLLS